MPRRRDGERVLGPYAPTGRRKTWRVRHIHASGEKVDFEFPTESAAQKAKAEIEAALAETQALVIETVGDAIDAYLASPDVTKNRKSSRDATYYALQAFFDRATPLWAITPARSANLYQRLIDAGKSVDTHRNYLSAATKFMNWCVTRSLISRNPLADVKGVGKRRKGKPKLRYRAARAWYNRAMELAEQGHDGAVAALINLIMAMRSSEIVHLRVDDIDEVEESGDTLWLDRRDELKTDASERSLEVPVVLRPFLLERCNGRRPDDLIFPSRDKSKPHDRDWVRAQVIRICRQVGVKEICAHAMRGMHSELARERGISARLVADSLGHENERTTIEAYIGERAERASKQRQVMKVLEGGRRDDDVFDLGRQSAASESQETPG